MSNSKIQLWIGVAIVWLSHLTMDFMLGIWPLYKTLISLDLFAAGCIASCGMLIGEGLQLYFGMLSDRGYQKQLLTMGLALTVMIPFLVYVESMWVLFLCILAAYVGSGALHPAGLGILIGQAPTQKNFFISLFACGGMIGAAFSQIIFMKVYHFFSGHTWILAFPILILTLSCYLFNFPQGKQTSTKINFSEILDILKPHRPELILLYISQVCLQLVVLSFAFLLPEILQLKGYDEWFCFGGGYFYFILGAALAAIPISTCLNKFGYKAVLASITILSCLFLYIFLEIQSFSVYPIICLLLCIGGTMGIIVPVVVAGGNSFVPSRASSFVSALYMGGASCVAGFGPLLASFIASFFEDRAPIITLQLMSSFFLLALGLIYFLPEKKKLLVKVTA